MAEDKKLTELDTIATLSGGDWMYVVDVDDTSEHEDGTSKRISVDTLLESISGNTDAITLLGVVVSGEWNGNPISGEYISSHGNSHTFGNGDEISIDNLGSPTGTTELDSSIYKHGLTPSLSGGLFSYLNGYGEYSKIPQEVPDKYIKFLTVKNDGDSTIRFRSTTGYAAVQWWDGYSEVFGSGSSTTTYNCVKTIPSELTPFGGNAVKQIYIWPVDSSDVTASIFGDLTYINASNQDITYAHLLSASGLEDVYLTASLLDSLDLRGHDNVDYINLTNSSLVKKIDLSGTSSVNYLSANSNDIEKILLGDGAITNLAIQDNNISELNNLNFNDSVSYNYLNASNNNISNSINIAESCSFIIFNVSNNNISQINMNGSYGHSLAGSDVIDVSYNNMSATELNNFFTSLGSGQDPYGAGLNLDVSNNPGSATCDTSIATTKGYTVITT